MVKKIRIIVGNSAYKDNCGFGYSSLKFNELENETLKEVYKDIPEIAFIPKFEEDSATLSEEYFKYMEVLSFRRLLFLLLGSDFKNYNKILDKNPAKIAENFMNYNIYFVNKNNFDSIIKNIKKCNDYNDGNNNLEIHILYVGSEAKKIMDGLSEGKKYHIIHPAARGTHMGTCLKSWIYFNYEEENSSYTDSKSILENFRIEF